MHARSQLTDSDREHPGGAVFAGIDSHKDSLAVAVVDQVGLPVARCDEPNTRSGLVRIGELLAKHHVTRVGIEGSGHFGRCVAAYLALDWDEPGVAVLEVPTLMTSRERGARPGKGKTDPIDAVAIARITMREPDLPPVRLAVGDAADLRALLDYGDDLVVERGDLVNRAHIDLHGLFPGYHEQTPDLISKTHLQAAQLLLAGDLRVRAEMTRRRLARIMDIDVEAAGLKRRIAGSVAVTRSSLTSIYGVGPIIAARFLAEVVDINRYANRNTFAATNGTAPMAASPGRTQRHRFNPGGNRRLNRCLYTIAITRIRADTEGGAYYLRKREAGKTKREALRCLKRRLSDIVYSTMRRDADGVDAASATRARPTAHRPAA
jgi:transposase